MTLILYVLAGFLGVYVCLLMWVVIVEFFGCTIISRPSATFLRFHSHA